MKLLAVFILSIYDKQYGFGFPIVSKIEKVPRGIQDEMSRKDTANSVKLVSTIGALASPQKGMEPVVRKGEQFALVL